jgi:hypothetical protein
LKHFPTVRVITTLFDNATMDKKGKQPEKNKGPLVEGLDYYREGPFFVFTEYYHLKRGSCCGSGCRHCPYRKREPGKKREE